MREIIKYLSDFIKQTRTGYLLSVVVFVALYIFVEYYFGATKLLLGAHRYSLVYFWGHCIIYALPLVVPIFAYIVFYKRTDLLTNGKFWSVVAFIIVAYSFRAYFYQHREWAIQINDGNFDLFIVKSTNQLAQALQVIMPVLLFWIVSKHYKETPLYGFKLKGINLKPYCGLLAIMLPLVAVASSQADFLSQYPMAKSLLNETDTTIITSIRILIYELLYGFDFIATELFFRGFMVFVLVRYMGPGAILAMAAMYVSIHFGKPLGETISSFFGGAILGVIAWRTNSIAGGVIVHCGIAWLMEIGGFVGNAFID